MRHFPLLLDILFTVCSALCLFSSGFSLLSSSVLPPPPPLFFLSSSSVLPPPPPAMYLCCSPDFSDKWRFFPPSSKLRWKECLIAIASAFVFSISYLCFSSSSFYQSFLPLLYSSHFPSFDGSPLPDLSLLPPPPPPLLVDHGGAENTQAESVIVHEQELDSEQERRTIEEVLLKASMPNKTVILTTLNAAWARKGTMVDLFLESFRNGEGTEAFLKHVVFVCLDQRAYDRCMELQSHCIKIKTGGIDYEGEQALLSADYIKMIWRRIEFLGEVLEMNYNFIFTDTDVLWLRDPMASLLRNSEDFQIACDRYNGKPWDVKNKPNAGFTFVRANERTLRFYRYWHEERKRGSKLADQEVFNLIKTEGVFQKMGMSVRFLDTQYFGGFCASKTSDMKKALTMHATCCKGLDNKLHDLKMVLSHWKLWKKNITSSAEDRDRDQDQSLNPSSFPLPKTCLKSMH